VKRLTEISTGLPAAGAAGAPLAKEAESALPAYEQIPQIGDYLITHGPWLLTWAEVAKIAGALYVTLLSLKMLWMAGQKAIKLIKWTYSKIRVEK